MGSCGMKGAQSVEVVAPPEVSVQIREGDIRVLLITHNVSGVFDDPKPSSLQKWVAELQALVARHKSDFVALHLQEVGGTSWRGSDMTYARTVAHAVQAGFPDHWCSGMFLMGETADQSKFSALGNMYLVTAPRRP